MVTVHSLPLVLQGLLIPAEINKGCDYNTTLLGTILLLTSSSLFFVLFTSAIKLVFFLVCK